MPLFFFDVYDNGAMAADEFGIELDSALEARHQAIAILPDMARDELPDGEQHEFKSVVRCEDGRLLYVATLTYRGQWRPGGNPEAQSDDDAAPEPGPHGVGPLG